MNMQDKSSFKISYWYIKECFTKFWSWLSLSSWTERVFFLHSVLKGSKPHCCLFPWHILHEIMQAPLWHETNYTNYIWKKKKVQLRSEQLLHDQWARVRSDVVVFGNGFIQIQLSAVDLHLHAAIIKCSHWCSTQRNICTETHSVY